MSEVLLGPLTVDEVETSEEVATGQERPLRIAGMKVLASSWRWLARPIATVLAQVWGVVTITFFLMHLMPGNPAYRLAGAYATPEELHEVEVRLGLGGSLLSQYWIYIRNLFHGDLGKSIVTGNAVSTDIAERLPPTLGLITVAMVFCCALTVALTWLVVARPRGWLARLIRGYSVIGAGIPDFFVAILLVYVVYYSFGLGPSPTGQLDAQYSVHSYTGFASLDALISGNMVAFGNAVAHLVLPVATVVIATTGIMTRLTCATAISALNQDHIRFARALGVRRWRTNWYVVRTALPTLVSTTSLCYVGALGSAVLVETVFGWGGLGQYSTSGLHQSDYAAVQAFVLVAGVFTAVVYALVDVAYRLVDPRSRR